MRKDARMSRHLLRPAVLAALILTGAQHGVAAVAQEEKTKAEKAVADGLAVQRALLQGRNFLRQGQPAKAVAVLEAELPRIDGSRVFLTTLREAYRAYVTDLSLQNQEEQAHKYLERLRILDPDAAAALEIHPGSKKAAAVATALAAPTPAVAQPQPAKPEPVSPAPAYVSPLRTAAITPATLQPKFRGVSEDDPFSRDNKLLALPGETASKQSQARDLLAQAQAEFAKNRFVPAGQLFEQAHEADKGATTGSQNQWAYCKLYHVFERLQQTGDVPLTGLEQEVESALALSSSPKLTDFGKSLRDQIGQRRKGAAAQVSVKHYADGRSGWQVAETSHFRVYHQQPRELAEKTARIAEQTRQAMSRKWFGHDGGDWQPRCDLYLHSTGNEYSRITGVPASSPGHSRIETDPSTGRVVSRRMDLRCDNPTMLEAVLPHETTHVVLAGQLGSQPVPRWVDEGIAVLSEPADKVKQHLQNLTRSSRQHDLFSLRDLMQMDQYPPPQRIATFYAQSVALVDFLSRQKGPQVFSQFVRDGLREGYEPALRRHYDLGSFADLEARLGQGTALAER
jgi:hypothetical protein